MPRGFVDVNGDKKADYIVFRGDLQTPQIWVYFSRGRDASPIFNPEPDYKSPPIDKGYDNMPRGFADFNGDGLPDYCTFRGDPKSPQIWVYHAVKNSANQFVGFEKDPSRKSSPIKKGDAQFFTDIDGNNYADYITIVGKRVWIYYGPMFTYTLLSEDSRPSISGSDYIMFADINRDRKEDLIAFDNDNIFTGGENKYQMVIHLSDGNTYEGTPYRSGHLDRGYPSMPYGFANIDKNDGMDYVTFRGDPQFPEIWIYLNKVKAFNYNYNNDNVGTWGQAESNPDYKTLPFNKGVDYMPRGFADIDGDGYDDYITFLPGSDPDKPKGTVYWNNYQTMPKPNNGEGLFAKKGGQHF